MNPYIKQIHNECIDLNNWIHRMYDFVYCMSSYILKDEKQKFFWELNHQSHYTRYHTTTMSLGITIYILIYILYALYDSHERENDVTKEIWPINLKGKEFVFGGSKNSNRTDCTPIKRSFWEKPISFFYTSDKHWLLYRWADKHQ